MKKSEKLQVGQIENNIAQAFKHNQIRILDLNHTTNTT